MATIPRLSRVNGSELLVVLKCSIVLSSKAFFKALDFSAELALYFFINDYTHHAQTVLEKSIEEYFFTKNYWLITYILPVTQNHSSPGIL